MMERTEAAMDYSRGCLPLSRFLPRSCQQDGGTRSGSSATALRFEKG